MGKITTKLQLGLRFFCCFLILVACISLFSKNAAEATFDANLNQFKLASNSLFLARFQSNPESSIDGGIGEGELVVTNQNKKKQFLFTDSKKNSDFLWVEGPTVGVDVPENLTKKAIDWNFDLQTFSIKESFFYIVFIVFLPWLTWGVLAIHPRFYGSWLIPALLITLYVSQAGTGFSQLSLCLMLLLLGNGLLLLERRHLWVLSFLFLMACVPTIYLMSMKFFTQGPLQNSEIIAVLQSNTQEVIDYLSQQVGWLEIAGLVFLAIAYCGYFSRPIISNKPQKQPVTLLVTLFCLLLLGFALPINEYPGLKEYKQAEQQFKEQERIWKTLAEQRVNVIAQGTETKQQQDETMVLVLGESLSKHHMGLYGYSRETTPLLAQQEQLLIFQDVISSHTQTLQSLLQMLSQSDNTELLSFENLVSIINVANAAGVETHWLSNQTKYGFGNNFISNLASESENTSYINEVASGTSRNRSQSYDERLLPLLENALGNEVKKNQLVFLHLFGSHSSYSKRYPSSFEKFDGESNVMVRGETLRASDDINEYDNSVLYNDYVVSEIIEQLKKKDCVCIMLYSPDHGENLPDGTAHDATIYHPLMVEVPLMLWYSKAWAKRYPEKLTALQAHLFKPYMTDALFHSVIGLLDIKTKLYKASDDLSSKQFYPKKQRYTLHGKRQYQGL